MPGSGELMILPVHISPRMTAVPRRAQRDDLQRPWTHRVYRLPPPSFKMFAYDALGRGAPDTQIGSQIDLYI